MPRKSPGKRGETWDIKTRPELLHPVLEAKHDEMVRSIKQAYYDIDRLYERVAKILDEKGIHTQARLIYRAFAEELWRISTRFKSKTLNQLAFAIKCLYVNYACDEDVLNEIARLFGLILPPCAIAQAPLNYSLLSIVYSKDELTPLANALVRFEWDMETVEKTTNADGKAKVEDAIPKNTTVKVTASKVDLPTWPMFHHDPQHTGRAAAQYLAQSKSITITQDDALLFLLTLAPHIIYVGSFDTYLYALNPDGTLKWKFGTGDWVLSSPAIAPDGTIYVGSEDYYLYALNPDGTLKWKFGTGDYIDSSPAIAPDGTIYVGSYDYYLYALNPDGTLKWKFKTGAEVWSSPAVIPQS